MIERKTLSQEDIDAYPYRRKPWCKLCSQKARYVLHDSFWGTSPMRRFEYVPTILRTGEAVVKVTYRNRTVAYYHESCWTDEKNSQSVKNIEKQASVVFTPPISISYITKGV